MSSTGRTQGTPNSFLGNLISRQKAPEPELKVAPAEAQDAAKAEAAPAAENPAPTASDSFKLANNSITSQPKQSSSPLSASNIPRASMKATAESRVPAQKQASTGAQQLKGKSGVPGKTAMPKKASSTVSAPDQSIWAALSGQAAPAKKGEDTSPVAGERMKERAAKAPGSGAEQAAATGPVAEAAKDPGQVQASVPQAAKDPGQVQASVPQVAQDPGPVQASVPQAAMDPGPVQASVSQAAKDPGQVQASVPQAAKDADPVQSHVTKGAKDAAPMQASVAEAAKDAGPAVGPVPERPDVAKLDAAPTVDPPDSVVSMTPGPENPSGVLPAQKEGSAAPKGSWFSNVVRGPSEPSPAPAHPKFGKNAGKTAGPDPSSPNPPKSVGAPVASAQPSSAEPIGATSSAASQLPGGVLPLPQGADIFATDDVRRARASFDTIVANAFNNFSGLRAEDLDTVNAAGKSLTDARKLAAGANLGQVATAAAADGQFSADETAQLIAATQKLKEAEVIAPPASTVDRGAALTNAKLLADAAKADFDKLVPGGLTGDSFQKLSAGDMQLLGAALANMKFATNNVAIEVATEAYEKAKTAALSDGHITVDELSDFNAKQSSIQNLCGQSKALMGDMARSHTSLLTPRQPTNPGAAPPAPGEPRHVFPSYDGLDPRLSFYALLPAPIQASVMNDAMRLGAQPMLGSLLGMPSSVNGMIGIADFSKSPPPVVDDSNLKD